MCVFKVGFRCWDRLNPRFSETMLLSNTWRILSVTRWCDSLRSARVFCFNWTKRIKNLQNTALFPIKIVISSPTLPHCNSFSLPHPIPLHSFSWPHGLISRCSCSGDGHQADAVLQAVFLKIKKSLPGASESWWWKRKNYSRCWANCDTWQRGREMTSSKTSDRLFASYTLSNMILNSWKKGNI